MIEGATEIPPDWNAIPFSESTQVYGDNWLEGNESAAMKLPSAVVPDTNVLLNPTHPDFSKLVVDDVPVKWDPRLIG